MNEPTLILGVVVMFLTRIGIPVLVLIVLGVLIDRWQSQRDDYIQQHYGQRNDDKQVHQS